MNQVVALKKEIPMPPENLQDDHIQKLYKDVLPRVVRMTPEWARELLSKNTRNRQLYDSHVKYYMQMISQGEWEMNGSSIKVGSDGAILDGQHRLEAISRTNISVDTLFITGLDPATFKTIDTGKNRTYKDHLFIAGVEGSDLGALASAAPIVRNVDFATGIYNHERHRLSPSEMIDFCEKYPGIEQAIATLPANIKRIVPRAMAGAMKYLFDMVDPTASELFFEGFATGAGLVEGSPILALRNRLMQLQQARIGLGSKAARRQVIAYIVSAWSAYKEGRALSTMTYRPEWVIKVEGLN